MSLLLRAMRHPPLNILSAVATLLALAACATIQTPQPKPETAPAAPPTAVAERAASGFPGGRAEEGGARGWWATSWTEADGEGFFGRPVTTTSNTSTNLIVRYTRYSTDYDVAMRTPVWGAYTVDLKAVEQDIAGTRTASNPDFARPREFSAEPLVVAASRRLGIPAATHQSYADAIDPRFPVPPSLTPQAALAQGAIIQRGHMVPNNALKCSGTYAEGQVAQRETFSTANIVPQMKLSNAPSWSDLESACLDWAKELGQVWLFVGPIYWDRARPVMAEKRVSREKLPVPCPDELYYVVIGKRGGRVSAVAFRLQHLPEVLDFRAKAVPVDEIEAATGINFMPELGEPSIVEAAYDPAWLRTPKRKSASVDS